MKINLYRITLATAVLSYFLLNANSSYSQEKINDKEAFYIFQHHAILACYKASYSLDEKQLESLTRKTRLAFTGTQTLTDFYQKYEQTRDTWYPLATRMAREMGFPSIADYALYICNDMRSKLGLPEIPYKR